MKKMTKSAQMQANGGWGAYCDECGWHKTNALKLILKNQVKAHNKMYDHNAYIC